ncbi:TPA: accessory Sec system protein Asp3 [Streptococcus suis]
MVEALVQKLLWTGVTPGVNYLYGSMIQIQKDSIFFENLHFSPGKPIKTWRSRTNYQANRSCPELPLLYPGVTYRLEQKVTITPEQTAYFQIQYFNRQNEEIQRDILRNGQEEFTFPKDAFTYRISLMSAGCRQVEFFHIAIYGPENSAKPLVERNQVSSYTSGQEPEELRLVSRLIHQKG